MLDDIDDFGDNEEEDDDDEKKKKKIYHKCHSKVRKPTIHVDFKPFNSFVQQHDNIKPTKRNTK
jgi:hypothetical protein